MLFRCVLAFELAFVIKVAYLDIPYTGEKSKRVRVVNMLCALEKRKKYDPI